MRASFPALTTLMLVFTVACGSASDGPAPTNAAPTTSVLTTPSTELLDDESAQDQPSEAVRVRINYGSEPDQFGRLQLPAGRAPDGGFPLVVLIHGGFWREMFFLDLMNNVADELADIGYASWNIEFRRVHGAGGWPETGDDVAAAIDHLADIAPAHPIDLDCVVSAGHSAGGHLALWALGHEDRVEVKGAVGLGAVIDLEAFTQSVALLGGTIDDVPDVYADAAPVLDPNRVVIIHAGRDEVIPVESLRPAEEAGVPIVIIDDDRHFDLIRPPSDSWSEAIAAIEGLMTPTCAI